MPRVEKNLMKMVDILHPVAYISAVVFASMLSATK